MIMFKRVLTEKDITIMFIRIEIEEDFMIMFIRISTLRERD